MGYHGRGREDLLEYRDWKDDMRAIAAELELSPSMYTDTVTRMYEMYDYSSKNGKTYCNFAVADVAYELNVYYPMYERTHYYTADAFYDWLTDKRAIEHGWQEVDLLKARIAANEGLFTVAVYHSDPDNDDDKDSKGNLHGHMQMVVPHSAVDEAFAQAGKLVYTNGELMNRPIDKIRLYICTNYDWHYSRTRPSQ